VITHAEQFSEFPPKTATAIAETPAIFAAAAQFIDSLAPVLNGNPQIPAPLRAQFTELFRDVIGKLAQNLTDPDIAMAIQRTRGKAV
jgi:hypothetical protein